MKVWLLFDYQDVVGVFETEQVALAAIPSVRRSWDFKAVEYEVQR
jgi:hypothetical protein